MRLVFLDIDGVLNDHFYDDSPDVESSSTVPECVYRLNRILREADARLVVSSAWRYMVDPEAMTLRGFEYLLRSHGVAAKGRLIGVTPRDEEIPTRGEQVRAWMDRHGGGARYVVLDDGGTDRETREWSDLGLSVHPFVRVKGNVGLTDADVNLALFVLNGSA